jgi:hypothetical protein
MFDVNNLKCIDQTVFSDVDLEKRVYHQGFLIDDSLYSLGGVNRDGKVLNEFITINIKTKKHYPQPI